MTGWQVDVMIENENARIWEELNAPDPLENELKEAAIEMRKSIELLDKAENGIVEAASILDDTPMGDKLTSLYESILDLKLDIKNLADAYGKGRRE